VIVDPIQRKDKKSLHATYPPHNTPLSAKMIIASANGRRFALARVLLTASTDAFLSSYNILTRRFSALCATSTTSTLNSYPPTPADLVQCFSPKEWEQRCSLAVAYRTAYLHSWHEKIFNHITLKVDGSDDSPESIENCTICHLCTSVVLHLSVLMLLKTTSKLLSCKIHHENIMTSPKNL
jgi:hypothetical protein